MVALAAPGPFRYICCMKSQGGNALADYQTLLEYGDAELKIVPRLKKPDTFKKLKKHVRKIRKVMMSWRILK